MAAPSESYVTTDVLPAGAVLEKRNRGDRVTRRPRLEEGSLVTRATDGARETGVAWRLARIQDLVFGSADTHRSSCEDRSHTNDPHAGRRNAHVPSADLLAG